MINKSLSNKFKIISFLGILFVLYIHATILDVDKIPNFAILQSVIRYFCNSFFNLFFLFSGFFFFQNKNRKDFYFFKKSIQKRIQTNLIPYILWNILIYIFFVIASNIPFINKFINSNPLNVFEMELFDSIKYLFFGPFGFHLWFLRDLILMTFLSPLIHLLIKHFRIGAVILSITISLIFKEINFLKSLVPFCVGAFIVITEINVRIKSNGILILVLVIINFVAGYLHVNGDISNKLTFYVSWLPFLLIWYSYDKLAISKSIKRFVLSLSKINFFIYLFHIPLLSIVKRGIQFVLNYSNEGL